MESLIGAIAGVLGTIPMTILMWASGKAPASSVVWSYLIGDSSVKECAYTRQNLFFHFTFGAIFGVSLWVVMYITQSNTYGEAMLAGIAFGILLTFMTGVVWFPMVFDFEVEQKQVVLYVFYHLTYGITTATAILFFYQIFGL